jgi:hypothetical protein
MALSFSDIGMCQYCLCQGRTNPGSPGRHGEQSSQGDA